MHNTNVSARDSQHISQNIVWKLLTNPILLLQQKKVVGTTHRAHNQRIVPSQFSVGETENLLSPIRSWVRKGLNCRLTAQSICFSTHFAKKSVTDLVYFVVIHGQLPFLRLLMASFPLPRRGMEFTLATITTSDAIRKVSCLCTWEGVKLLMIYHLAP